MLTKLFSSVVRVKILKLLFLHSDSFFTMAEISRKTDSLLRSVSKEIKKLAEIGAVVEEIRESEINQKKIKIKHYRANKDFLLFSEIKDLLFKAQLADLYNLKDKLAAAGKIKYFVLCGRFTGETESAVDLLIVGKINRDRFKKIINNMEKFLGEEINYAILDNKDFEYRQKVGDIFLFNIVSGKRIEIINEL